MKRIAIRLGAWLWSLWLRASHDTGDDPYDEDDEQFRTW